MDYTTLARTKAEMDAQTTVADTRLALMITAASRAIDRKCTGVPDPDAVDYFKAETKTAEIINGQMDNKGRILTYPHKPYITEVTSFEYRHTPVDAWVTIPVDRVAADGPRVEAWPQPPAFLSSRCRIQITYTGGLASTTDNLPADLIEAATILAIRFYKESETGLTDAIGVAELATLVYTKAWPVRVLDQLQPFIRTAGWRDIA